MSAVHDALRHPAPGQLQLLLDHTWLLYEHLETVTFEGRAFLFSSEEHYAGFQAYRERDRGPGLGDGWYEPRLPSADGPARVASDSGRAHFRRLLDLPDFEELALNAGTSPPTYLLAEFARQALTGRDLRPGAEILQARSEEEIELYLSQHGMVGARREGNRYVSHDRSVEFEPAFVEGRSRILCLACLANLVLMRAELAAPSQREQSLRWARDVLSHLEDDRLPAHTLRSTYGRYLAGRNPRLLEGETLRAALATLLSVDTV